jgi:hypothetical protein
LVAINFAIASRTLSIRAEVVIEFWKSVAEVIALSPSPIVTNMIRIAIAKSKIAAPRCFLRDLIRK